MTIDEHAVSFAGHPRHSRTWQIQDIRQLMISLGASRHSLTAARGAWLLPAKHRKVYSQGSIAFGADAIVYPTKTPGESRTWRYSDIGVLSNSGPFEPSVTTLETTFHFQWKQPLPEARYGALWMELQRKNASIQ
jgi:hypothetical protein